MLANTVTGRLQSQHACCARSAADLILETTASPRPRGPRHMAAHSALPNDPDLGSELQPGEPGGGRGGEECLAAGRWVS